MKTSKDFPKYSKCPKCGEISRKHSIKRSEKISLFGKKIEVVNPRYYCVNCKKYFTKYQDRDGRYSRSVYRAVKRWYDLSKTYEENSEMFESCFGVKVPVSTLCDWMKEHE